MAKVEELETVVTYKKIAQNIKTTASSLEKMEKTGIEMKEMTMRIDVPETKYSVVYKVITNPHKKIIAKKIIKC
jgi:hypothetical protein